MAKVDLRADGKFILPGKNEPSFVCEDLYLLRQKGSPGERMSSIVRRTIVRNNFVLAHPSVYFNWLVGNITSPDCLYSLFALVGCSETHFWLHSQRCLAEILL